MQGCCVYYGPDADADNDVNSNGDIIGRRPFLYNKLLGFRYVFTDLAHIMLVSFPFSSRYVSLLFVFTVI